MAGSGRPNKYHEYVEPYLDDILQMAQTMTERQIAEKLEISYSTFRKYKAQFPALKDNLKKGRRQLILDIHSALIRKAKGFEYEERKIIKKNGKVTQEEIYKRVALPDVAAINLALKNFDPDHWANDPQMLQIREKELRLRKQQIDQNEW